MMIHTLDISDLPAFAFPDVFHHVIPRSYRERRTEQVQWLTDNQGGYGCYHPHTGLNLAVPEHTDLAPWALWIYQQRIALLAGERRLHFRLLQALGALLPEDSPDQVLCRYEFQDFCIHSSALKAWDEFLPVKKAQLKDVDKLFYFYKRSETMEARSLESLKETIQNNRLFFIQKMGKILTAALTHCESSQAALIGGVYTPKPYRGQGFSKLCLSVLMAELKSEGKTPCLFFEQNNQAAHALYQSLGFKPYGEWVIAELIYPSHNPNV